MGQCINSVPPPEEDEEAGATSSIPVAAASASAAAAGGDGSGGAASGGATDADLEEADEELHEEETEMAEDEYDELDMLGGVDLAMEARAEPLSKEEARDAVRRAKAAGAAEATAEDDEAGEGHPRMKLHVDEVTIEEDDEAVPRFAFSGQFIEPSSPPAPQPAKPAVDAELEWVHGYRGWDCRANVHFVKDGEAVVYPSAGVAVIHDGSSQSFFKLHDDDILSCAVHPSGKIVATGQIGRYAKVLVWDVETLECLATLEGFAQRAARHLAFSGDGNVLAVCGEDDSHTVALYKWRETSKPFTATKAGREPVNAIALNGDGSQLLTVGKRASFVHSGASGEKHRKVSLMKAKKVLMSGKGKIQTFWSAAFTPDGRGLIGTQSGCIYELARGGRAVQKSHKTHKGPIASLTVVPAADGGSFLSTASKDGSVVVHKLSPTKGLGEVLGRVRSPHGKGKLLCTRASSVSPDGTRVAYGSRAGVVATCGVDGSGEVILTTSHHDDELWGLAISPDGKTVATAGDDFTIRVWSIEERREIAQTSVGIMARALAFSPDGKYLAVGCGGRVGRLKTGTHGKDDGTVVLLDYPSLDEIKRVKHSRQWISDVAFGPEDGPARLAVCSHDNKLYLLDPTDLSVIGKGTKSPSFLTRVDFSTDGAACRVTTGAHEVLFYSAETGAHIPGGAEAYKDEEWHTVRCPLNWAVQGVWPSYADGTDINAVAVSADKSIIASGDDFSRVRLFRYPCIEHDMWERIELTGHSSHVTNLVFTPPADDGTTRLFSTGGNDKALFQWKLTPTEDHMAGMTDIGTL